MPECGICGKEVSRVVRHHISYEYDTTIEVCDSCHRKIHRRPEEPPLFRAFDIDKHGYQYIRVPNDLIKELKKIMPEYEDESDSLIVRAALKRFLKLAKEVE